ncbi:MAG: SDR family NAD(P)-dependent oxidoreductase, partial [Thermoplasmata archaeon]|nr:SDR family NAD(P)-dependent oxidoreductase [Thermoplasmata archaeon]
MSGERDLSGEVALVTGASRGIGRAIAIALAHEGASVMVNYLKERERAEETVAVIKESGGNAMIFQADVRVSEEVQNLIQETSNTLGRLDILVNNAGVISDSLILR